MSTVGICPKILCWPRDVKKLIRYVLKVCTRLFQCKSGHRQVCGSDTKKIRSRLCTREHKTKKQGKIQQAPPASQLFSAMPPLEVVKLLVSIMMSVSLSKPLKLRHYNISRAHFPRNGQETHSHQTTCRGSSEEW